jgi:hypothetical protein
MGDGLAGRRAVARVGDRRLAVEVAVIAAIAIAAWPVRTLEPGVAFDWDWVGALAYAAQHGLSFGEQVVFTYGPLGFLNSAHGPVLFYDHVLLLAWLFTAIVQLLLAGTLLIALRRSFPTVVAVVLAVVILALAPDRAVALAFAWCVLVLTRDEDAPPQRVVAAIPIALGVLTGVLLLGKLNQGIEALALACVALVAVPRRRDALVFTAALLASAVVGWLASGQTPADLWSYLRHSFEVVAGYGAAMGLDDHAHRWTYPAAALLTAAALALAWGAARDASPRRRWGLLAAFLVYALFTFKEGFVRQDTLHLTIYFGDMIVMFAVVPVRRSRRLLAVGAIAASVVAFGAMAGLHDVTRRTNPYANVKAVADQARTLLSPTRRGALKSDLRTAIATAYGVAPELVGAIGKRTVMMWPFLFTEVAYAYDLNLRFLPTLEPYATYTPALDRLDAEMLASDARAPSRILRLALSNASTIDERYATFEAPFATLAILCRYRQLAAQEGWQVLARARDRCGAPRTVSTVSAGWGAAVEVPTPRRASALVLVRVDGAEPHGLESLRSLLLRPKTRWIELDEARYRLVAATATDGLLLQVPSEADFPDAFAMAPNAGNIAVGRDGGEPGGKLRYTFVEVPIRPFSAR